MAAISAEALSLYRNNVYSRVAIKQVDEATDGGWHQGATAAVIISF